MTSNISPGNTEYTTQLLLTAHVHNIIVDRQSQNNNNIIIYITKILTEFTEANNISQIFVSLALSKA